MKKNWSRTTVLLPHDTKMKFKITCVKLNVEMSDVVRDLIEDWVKRQEEEGVK